MTHNYMNRFRIRKTLYQIKFPNITVYLKYIHLEKDLVEPTNFM